MSRNNMAFSILALVLLLILALNPEQTKATAWSVLPPLVTILLALVTREVLSALVIGSFVGCVLVAQNSLFDGYTTLLQYFVDGLKDPDKVKIVFFSLGLGGLISLCNRNGGMAGVVKLFTTFARNRASAQLSTWALGLCIFFDDYASSLVVGNTMRPTLDHMRVSREKLAYLVDATSAPIACIAPISTWIANQLGLFGTQIAAFPSLALHFNSYGLFLAALPFSFYAFFSIFMMFLLAVSNREFGPMLAAEQRVIKEGAAKVYGDIEADSSQTHNLGSRPRAVNAVLPIGVVLVMTLSVLYVTGSKVAGADAPLREIISSGSTGNALMSGAYGGCLVAILLGWFDRRFHLRQIPQIFMTGSRAMVDAVLVLSLSWLLGRVCLEAGTALFVAEAVKAHVSFALIPVLVFLVSSLVAFSTGTSWGTMGIMIPIVLGIVPLHDASMHAVFLPAVAAILAGASLGDHCSPISDTTVLSAIASRIDVLAHVRTQLPYVLVVGLACVAGYLIQGFLMTTNPLPGLVVGLLLIVFVVRQFGTRLEFSAIPSDATV